MKKVLPLFLALALCPLFVLAANRVDINIASLKELDALMGVGPAIAQRIVDGRPYYSVDDLLNVKGIGEQTIQGIKKQGLAYVDPSLKPPPPLPQPAPIRPASSLPKIQKTDNNMNVVAAAAPANLNKKVFVASVGEEAPNPWLLFMLVGAVVIILGLAGFILKLTLFKKDVRS